MAINDTIDADALARDVAALVQVPSRTGAERPAFERLGEIAAGLGLEPELHRHDLAALRADPEHPGEEAPRDELLGLSVTVPGGDAGRLCVSGHLDVVAPGTAPWRFGPWSGRIEDGAVHGRGSVDMKGGLVAALHGIAALHDPPGEVVLLAVSSEEDGGLGTFAELRRDDAYDACLIPEPTGLDVVCAQAGALTFRGTVSGRAAHAAFRLEGDSAIDRYVEVHAALRDHERAINAGVEHPLMRELALPYPLSVGMIEAGEWASTVPDRLTFAGRLGVRVGESEDEARAALAAALDGRVELEWPGGRYASAETPVDHPFVVAAASAVAAELGRPATLAGVPYGADLRLFVARGVPCVMCGPGGQHLAHAVDERVAVADLVAVARIVARLGATGVQRRAVQVR